MNFNLIWIFLGFSVVNIYILTHKGFPGGSELKKPPANAGDAVSIPGKIQLGGSPEERNGNPLQYSCLRNPMDKRSLASYSAVSQSVQSLSCV